MPTFNQRSFSGGEISPSLYARVDTSKYATGLRQCRNFEVMRHGGVQNRPGTEYVTELKSAVDPARLVPFVYNASQTYVLQFGANYLRFIQNGAQEILPAQAAWLTATAYDLGVGVSSGSATYYCIQAHTSGATTEPGVGADWEDYWYELTDTIIELPTPYAAADLADLQFVQSADVMTFVHPGYPIQELRRLAATRWTFSPRNIVSSLVIPTNLANNGAGSNTQKTITAANLSANPAVFTCAGHGLATNDVINLTFVYRMPMPKEFLGTYKNAGAVTVLTANTFTYKETGASASLNFPPSQFKSGSFVKTGTLTTSDYITSWVVTSVDSQGHESTPSLPTGTTDTPSPSKIITVTWDVVPGISRYNVYKKSGASYGFVGTVDSAVFKDNGITPDTTYTAPYPEDLFSSDDNYPGAVGYYQQRMIFAHSTSKPETVWASRTGDFTSFSKREPLQDDDRVEFTLAGRQVNAVRHLLDLGKLIIFTEGGEFAAQGDAAGILTPTDVNTKQYSYNGSSRLSPLVIGSNALYVQARGSIVRDLGFDIQVDGYKGNDLTIFAAHLVDDYTLVDWAFAQTPHSIVWAVRNDGTLLGLTYVPEHQVWGWHRHDTDGIFENVCVVPEGTEDAVYVVVSRSRYGAHGVRVTTKTIERFATRRIDDVRDAIFVDSAVSWDGRNTSATVMTLSGGTAWDHTEELTLTASASTFTDGYGLTHDVFRASGEPGNSIHLTARDGSVIRAEILTRNSDTEATVRVNRSVPVDLWGSATASWAKAIRVISNLNHLTNKAISVFGDGFVVASPYNSAYNEVRVNDSGEATLDKPYAVIHAGLPYLSDLETLDIDTAQGETLADKKKNIGRVSLFVEKSRGVWVGGSPPTDDTVDASDGLRELKIRNDEPYDSPVALRTETVDVLIRPEWNSNGRIFVRNLDPLPLTILAVAPAGSIQARG